MGNNENKVWKSTIAQASKPSEYYEPFLDLAKTELENFYNSNPNVVLEIEFDPFNFEYSLVSLSPRSPELEKSVRDFLIDLDRQAETLKNSSR